MWIIFKAIAALFTILFRLSHRKFRHPAASQLSQTINGITCHIELLKHNKQIKGTVLVVELECSAIFKLSHETSWDRYFKAIGLSKEIQTGDDAFDDLIYIACDSGAFSHELRHDETTRKKILHLMRNGATAILGDGKLLVIEFPGDVSGHSDKIKAAIELARSLSDLDRNFQSSNKDHFVLKAIAAECLIIALATYAFTSFLEWRIYTDAEHTIYLDGMSVVSRGLGVGVVLTILFFGLIVFLLKGSSRGHRIIAESALFLGLSLPIGGIALLSDLNTELDKGKPTVVERGIYRKYITSYRYKRRTYYHYHVVFDAPAGDDSIQLPGEITVSKEIYDQISPKKAIGLEIMPGRLGLAWFREIIY